MLDPKFIRDFPQKVRENQKKRGLDPTAVDSWLHIDKELRELKGQIDGLRHKRNTLSEKINQFKKQGNEKQAKAAIKEAGEIPAQIKKAEEKLSAREKEWKNFLLIIPNILDKEVPLGKSEKDNKVLRKVGAHKFKFKPKDHFELASNLDLIDQERANKVAGHGFFYLKEELALLDHALQRFAIDFLRKRGYKLIEPPFMIHKKPYEGVTSLSAFEEVMYKIENQDLYLIATAEHALAPLFMNETLEKKDLPIKLIGISPCFRKEVGSHGKYTKGLFRMHQFNKIEQFIFCLPEESERYFKELQKNAEDIFKALGLPYRISILCSADTGVVAAKTYDMEVLMADKEYREIGSNSTCTDYQARRLNIKYKEKEGMPPKGFLHTLNNTAVATSRVMLAILENYQQKDGSIKIPTILQKYMGMKVISSKSKKKAKKK